ncbi:MAG TPA: hypothetical protein VG816_08380 [Solirubrobacterales bacterium]|nr:hypothetical protein [Solirubrobacterales bacterium]
MGDECAGNTASGTYTLVPETHASGGTLPLAAPSGGVVTAWKVNSAYPTPVLEAMGVFRPIDTGKFELVGESNEVTVSSGTNVFATRLPIETGDRIGLLPVEEESPLYCATGDNGDHTWSRPGSIGIGAPHVFSAGVDVRVPLISTIEPDRDGDGYGDETQDRCPQSAAYHDPCPTISLDSFPIVLKRSVLLIVSASESAEVQVFGQVGWRPRHKGGALASKMPKSGGPAGKGVIVGLSGGTTLVKPGETTPYNVKLPKSVIHHLDQISPKQVVKATLTARTTDLAGRTVDHTITIRLHGRAKIHSAGTS